MMEQRMEDFTDDSKLAKGTEFLKRNAINLILCLSCLLFVFKDILQIVESKKTILEIIATGVLALVMSTYISVLLGRKGILAGQECDLFVKTMNRYNKEVSKTDENIDKLDDFCEKESEKNLALVQKKILRKGRIKYDDFCNKTMLEVCNTEEQIKVWKKALKAKAKTITADSLLSETDSKIEKIEKEKTIRQYEKTTNRNNMGSKILGSVISGYFTVSLVFSSWSGLLWGALQVCLWLVMGAITYITNYSYIKDTYRQIIIRKINLLIKFNTICEKEEKENGKSKVEDNV